MFNINNPRCSRILIFLLVSLSLPVLKLQCQTDTLINESLIINDNYNQVWDRFSLKMGTFIAGNNSEITLGSQQAGLGIVIDFEDALGLETSSFVFRGNANYRYGKRKRHSIVLDYFSINRKSLKIIEEELTLGDYTFPVGAEIDTKFYLSIIRAKYEYAFIQDDRVSIGFSAGLFIMPFNISFKSTNVSEQSANMVAPLPVIGLRSDIFITKKLLLKQSAELLYLKIDNFTGSILDLNFALEYKTFKHFGFGLGVNSNRLSISAKGEEYPGVSFYGDIKLDYTGLFLFLNFYL